MRNTFFVMLMLFFVSISYAEVDLKIVPNYGFLLNYDRKSDTGALEGGPGLIFQGFVKNNNKIKFGAEIGYISLYDYVCLDTNNSNLTRWSTSIIPIQGLIKYNLIKEDKNIIPFVIGTAGLNIVFKKHTMLDILDNNIQTVFGFGIGCGVVIKASDKTTIEPMIRYETIASECAFYNTYIKDAEKYIKTINVGIGIGF